MGTVSHRGAHLIKRRCANAAPCHYYYIVALRDVFAEAPSVRLADDTFCAVTVMGFAYVHGNGYTEFIISATIRFNIKNKPRVLLPWYLFCMQI